MKYILMMLALATLAGCEVRRDPPKEGEAPSRTLITEVSTGQLIRYYDTELRVTCYVFDGHKAGGISCLPPTPGMGTR